MVDRIPPAAIVFYEDHLTVKPLSIEQMPWQDVVELFSEHDFTDCVPCPGGKKCKKKFGTAFSPAVPRPGTTRGDHNVDWVSLLVFDFDHITQAELQFVCERFDGFESLVSSTHSHLHGGPDDCCVRIVLPFSRPLTPTEYRHVHREVRRRFGLEWIRPGDKTPSGADQAAKDISRLYFLPTAPSGSEVIEGHEVGGLLDLDDLLQNVAPEPSRASPRASAPKPPRAEGPADMEALRRCLRGYNPHKRDSDDDEVISRKELVQRVEAGEPLTDPEEVGQRERSCHRIGVILAWLLPQETPVEAVLELVRPSIMSLPTFADDGEKDTLEERFSKVQKSWFKGLEDRAAKDAKQAIESEQKKKRYEQMRKRFKLKGPNDPSKPPPNEPPSGGDGGEEEPAPEDDEWQEHLLKTPVKFDKEGKETGGQLRNVGFNANLILSASPEWADALRYNEVTKDVSVIGGPLELWEQTPAQVTTGTNYWLQQQWGLFLKKHEVMDAVVHTAKMNAFDPVRDYLNGVQRDEVDRIDTFLEVYCGALTVDSNGKDIKDHIRRISRCWLVGAVARGLNPGCKMDTVLILEGEQGVKKSTMLDVLGGEFFTDSPIVVGKNDAMMMAGRSWIAELGELTSVHASEVNAQKSFFSSRVDKFRPPYGYAIEEFPRRCAFAGSTNDERYMNDITGNRRYLAARCVKFDIRKARRDRDKIWAEAVEVYKAGFDCISCAEALDGEDRCPKHRWWLNEAENRILEMVNNQRLKNEFSEAILDYLLKLDPPSNPPKIGQRQTAYTMFEIAVDILKLTSDRVNAQQPAIGRALKTLGFEKDRRMENGIRSVWHVVPKDVLNAPKRERGGRHLHSVPSPTEDVK